MAYVACCAARRKDFRVNGVGEKDGARLSYDGDWIDGVHTTYESGRAAGEFDTGV